MNILFQTGMAFQFRSLLPVMKRLISKGARVFVLKKGCFSEQRIRNRPCNFQDVTRASLSFIAKQIGLDSTFLDKIRFIPHIRHFHFPPSSFYKKQDMFISTTKGFDWLNDMAVYGKSRIAIGYQNFIGTCFTKRPGYFPKQGCPGGINTEQDLISGLKVRYKETGLTFLDIYRERYRSAIKDRKTNKVMLLHPGGYRNIITKMRESKSESYRKQIIFYEKIVPYIPPDIKLAVKIHPLAALYHDRRANERLAKIFNFEIIEGFLGDVLFDYDATLSVGSSAFYEILSFGRTLWILDYISQERTRFYTELHSLFVDNGEALQEKLKNSIKPIFKQKFERDFCERLSRTADGHATERVMEIIDSLI